MSNENAIIRGRRDLTAWLAAQPTNLYADDEALQALVRYHGLLAREESLHATGRIVAGPLDAVVRENNLHRNLPVLDDWDPVGTYTGQVAHHPSWRTAGKLIYGTGVMAAYGEIPASHRYVMSLFYLTSQVGEGGHNCPLACDAGAIRSLTALGTPSQKERFLTRLLDPDFDTNFTASQFLTEVQGGSDVGANAAVAAPLDGAESAKPGGRWRIDGEKWFCSNADADLFLLTARIAAPQTGTRGLGLFLVPRRKADGSPNGFRLRRLKDKIGTRSMASGEIDFVGAEAEALGPAEQGFKNVMRWVINTSRVYNAFSTAAGARRAWVIASTYAQHREAFGRPIGAFTQVKETLAWMRADASACLASSMWLAELQEKMDVGSASDDEQAFFRVAVNINKLRTAMLAHETINRGIEVLGGNGAIESFSILPRLLRDNVVSENWEGTHNVLRAQVMRDAMRLGVHRGFFAVLEARLASEHADALGRDRRAFDELASSPEAIRDVRIRPLVDRLATWVMIGAMTPISALTDHLALSLRHLQAPTLDQRYVELLERLQRV
ncbi:MAG: acyl-CoA dehydrogenase family protein [Myxococcales bacterium]|nr:acyl-CoA dehydrogenase family protein [Myxococcales bacterium]